MSALSRVLIPFLSMAAGVAIVSIPGGCKSSSQSGPATVHGRVTFQGKPLVGGMVVFAPDLDRGFAGKPARGEIGADGSYTLQLEGSTTIPPGWYRVALADAPALDSVQSFGKPLFPMKLARPDQSGLIREVVAGQDNVYDFGVEVPANTGL